MKNKDDRIKLARLKKRGVKLMGVFVEGGGNFSESTLTSIVFPTPTKAYIEAINETMVEEQADVIRRMLDLKNSFCPVGDIIAIATGQSMEDHKM